MNDATPEKILEALRESGAALWQQHRTELHAAGWSSSALDTLGQVVESAQRGQSHIDVQTILHDMEATAH